MPLARKLASTWHRPAVLILLLLGLGLRLLRLDFQPLWWDEGYSVWFAGQSLLAMLRLTAADIHPPLYYALVHGWNQMLGLNPVMLRLFSVFASIPAIPLAYVLGRDLHSRRVGVIAAALVALNPLAIFYSQEIRMYGLAATLSLAALWAGWRWARPTASWRHGLGLGVSTLLGFYTLYYFALLTLSQTVWVLVAARRRLRPWLGVIGATVLLYLPWVLYAGPKLLDYVAYKIVKDNDTPLSLLPYLGRHLSAFLVGHLEGPLASLWPWALLLLIPLLLAFPLSPIVNSLPIPSSIVNSSLPNPALYLLLCLSIPLLVGFIQQLRAPFLPDRFERVLLIAAPAFWLLTALGLEQLWRLAKPAALVIAGLLAVAIIGSLVAFYTTPRYEQQDYRPLIADVRHNAALATASTPSSRGRSATSGPTSPPPNALPSSSAPTPSGPRACRQPWTTCSAVAAYGSPNTWPWAPSSKTPPRPTWTNRATSDSTPGTAPTPA